MTTRDIVFGSVYRTELCIRPIYPDSFSSWDDRCKRFRFSLRGFIRPIRYITSLKYWESWSLWFRLYKNMNHRCYCPVGQCATAKVVIGGWGFIAFYSRYTGPTRCVCDEAIAEIEADSAARAAREETK